MRCDESMSRHGDGISPHRHLGILRDRSRGRALPGRFLSRQNRIRQDGAFRRPWLREQSVSRGWRWRVGDSRLPAVIIRGLSRYLRFRVRHLSRCRGDGRCRVCGRRARGQRGWSPCRRRRHAGS
jgi:hypothetical protein